MRYAPCPNELRAVRGTEGVARGDLMERLNQIASNVRMFDIGGCRPAQLPKGPVTETARRWLNSS
jgi:hypothetical protein